jgi:uncharacterized protein YegL
MARRAPIYLVIDCSGSMTGEPIEAVNNGLQSVVSALRADPESLEKAHLCIITFSDKAEKLIPLTPITSIQIPKLTAEHTTAMGDAIRVLNESLKNDIVSNDKEGNIKGDYKAFVLLLTDGHPTDEKNLEKQLGLLERGKIKFFIGAAVPGANKQVLETVTGSAENVIELSTSNQDTFKRFFEWVSQSISSSIPTENPKGSIGELPPFADDDDDLF